MMKSGSGFSCCWRLLAPSQLPFILFSSSVRSSFPALSSYSLGISPSAYTPVSPKEVLKELGRCQSVKKRRRGGSRTDERVSSLTKEEKASGFSAILHWCTFYQQSLVLYSHPPSAAGTGTPRHSNNNNNNNNNNVFKNRKSTAVSEVELMHRTVNHAVLAWIRENAGTFSCGQSIIVLTLVSEILYQATHHFYSSSSHTGGTAVTASPSDGVPPQASNTMFEGLAEEEGKELIRLLHDVTLLLMEHIKRNEKKLEVQPLPVLASGLYSVFRLKMALKRIALRNTEAENMFKALQGSPSLLLLQSSFTAQLRIRSSESHTTPSSLSAMMLGNPTLGIKVLLTFFLCVDAPTRHVVLHAQEKSLLRVLSLALHRELKPLLTLKESQWSTPKTNTTSDGTEEKVEEEEDHVQDEKSEETEANIKGEESSAKEVDASNNENKDNKGTNDNNSQDSDDTFLSLEQSSPDAGGALAEWFHSQDFLYECIVIVRNMQACRPPVRIAVLEYLLFLVRSPSLFSDEEWRQVPVVLHSFRAIPSQYRANIVKELVRLCLLSGDRESRLATTLRLLPFLYISPCVVRETGIKEESAEMQKRVASRISATESTDILCKVGNFLTSTINEQLQRNVLKDVMSSTQEGLVIHSSSVPLTRSLVYVLHYFFNRDPTCKRDLFIEKRPGAFSSPVKDPHPYPPVECHNSKHHLRQNDEESASCKSGAVSLSQCYAELLPVLDWENGVKEDEFAHLESCDTSFSSSFSSSLTVESAAVETALTLYLFLRENSVRLSKGGAPVSVPLLSDKVFLTHYLRHLLLPNAEQAISHQQLMTTLQLVVRVTPLLSEEAYRRRLLERAIRYNFTASVKSVGAVLRFLDVLAPLVKEQSVVSAVALTSLLDANISSLNPLKGVPLYRFGSGAQGKRNYARYYTKVMLSASEYLLTSLSAEQNKVPTGTKEIMNKQLSIWIEEYFRAILKVQKQLLEHRSEENVVSTAGTAAEEENEEDADVGDTEMNEEGDEREVDEDEDFAVENGTNADSATTENFLDMDAPSADKLKESVPDAASTLEAPLLSQEEAEILFTATCRIGVHLPAVVYHTAIQKTVEEKCRVAQALLDGGGVLSSSFCSEHMPLPAHFIYFIRGGKKFPMKLTRTYLAFLLHNCDLRIFHLVVSAFILGNAGQLSASKKKSADKSKDIAHAREAWCNLCTTVTILLDRLKHSSLEKALRWSASTLVTHVIRVLLHQMDSIHPLLTNGGPPHPSLPSPLPSISVHSSSDATAANGSEEMMIMHESDSTPLDSNSSSVINEDGEEEMDRASLENLIMECGALITGKQHLQQICLTSLDKLCKHFPRLATSLFQRWVNTDEISVSKLTPKELLYLASSYPPSEALVRGEIEKMDIKVVVDIGDFLHYAKTVPMSIITLVVHAHLPSLSFAWCSRLLSSLTSRQGETPSSLLRPILARVEALVVTASDSDRNLLLMVLQGYLHPPSPSQAAAARTDDDDERRELIYHCYDAVLKVESVVSVATLRDFLRVTPTSLHEHIMPALIERVETYVLPSLLSPEGNSADITSAVGALLQVTRLLYQEKMLAPSIRRRIASAIFNEKMKGLVNCVVVAEKHSSPTSDTDNAAALERAPEEAPKKEGRAELTREALQKEVIRPLVELALLLVKDADNSTSTAAAELLKGKVGGKVVESALEEVAQYFHSASHKLLIVTALVELGNAGASKTVPAINSSSSGGNLMMKSRVGVSYQQKTPVASQGTNFYTVPTAFLEKLIRDIVRQCHELSPLDFVKFLQYVSKTKLWDAITGDASGSLEVGGFHLKFQKIFSDADAHTRCVLMRAVATPPAPLLPRYTTFMARPLLDAVDVLSYEDLELILATIMQMDSSETMEMLLDAVGTRVISIITQCKPSTFVRLLQCHAMFMIRDDTLFSRVLDEMLLQCCVKGEMRLSVAQVMYFLQAAVALELMVPERLLVACFSRVEKAVETLPRHQLVLMTKLAVEVEMGYNADIHSLISALLDNRSDYRTTAEEKETIELLCDVYDVEAPYHWRHTRLRERKKKMRQEEDRYYLEHRLSHARKREEKREFKQRNKGVKRESVGH